MADEQRNNGPAEIFGYPVWNRAEDAQDARGRRWCRFQNRVCDKKSRLIDFPFGVCSVQYGGDIRAVCPRRFDERGSVEGVSIPLENIALHYFGDLDNIIAFSEVRLPNVGNIDYVLVRHKPLKPEVDDFVSVEFQSDSTTSTGELVRGIRDFFDGRDLGDGAYRFGMNTYDSIKRAVTQLMNKGVVYESWNTKCYWGMQEYIYANLVARYGFKTDGFDSAHSSRFALYNLVGERERLTLAPTRFVSTTVDEIYQAIRNKPGMPDKDEFVLRLNAKLRVGLRAQAT